MTGRPVAKLCRTCCARFHPIDKPACDACGPDRAAVNNTKKRGRPKPPELVTAVASSVPDEPTPQGARTDLVDNVHEVGPLDLAAQLAALPEPSLADLDAYLK